jgi:hypothetical protein
MVLASRDRRDRGQRPANHRPGQARVVKKSACPRPSRLSNVVSVMTPIAAPVASHTTTTLTWAPDNSAATSTSKASNATVSSRDRATASTLDTSNGATARASAAATGFHRLAVLCPFLVDDACGNLRGQWLGLALVEQALLDVRLLAFALGAPGFLRHGGSLGGDGWNH